MEPPKLRQDRTLLLRRPRTQVHLLVAPISYVKFVLNGLLLIRLLAQEIVFVMSTNPVLHLCDTK
jgi:hypothetical protein